MNPAMLSKFPPKNKKGLKIDAEHVMELPKVRISLVIMKQAFPMGYRIYEQNERPKSR